MENKTKQISLIAVFIGAIFVLSLASLWIGKSDIGWFDLFQNAQKFEAAKIIIWEIRTPRTLLALLCGAGLALCGAVLQGFLRNPLADAGVLGISSFASLGAIIAIYFGLSAIGFWVLPILAIGFSGLCMMLLLLLVGNQASSIYFILSGVVLSTISSAIITIALTFAPNPYAVSEIIDWQIGSFSESSLRELALATPIIIVGSYILLLQGRKLDTLVLGEETAQSLGLDIIKTRRLIIFGVSLIIGALTAICGIIGFVGLIVPHIIRPFFGNIPSKSLIPSMLFGAILTLSADILVRLLWFQNELKVGVVMTILGAPFFLHLMWKMRVKGGANGKN